MLGLQRLVLMKLITLVIRGRFSDDDDGDDSTRARVKYRIIKGV